MPVRTVVHSPPRLLNLERKPDILSLIMMLAGIAGVGTGGAVVFYNLFTEGHAAFNTSSDMPWGAPIAFYLFFLLTSSGLSIIASLDSVFGFAVFYPAAKRLVFLSIVCLIAGFSILALEIGRPFRMLWALPLSLQFHSPMWWMGVFYSLDLLLLVTKFWLLHRGRWSSRLTHVVSIVSFVVCILAAGTLGLVFGMMAMRPAWYSPVMPMYFILTGFASAAAFLLFFTSTLTRDRDPAVALLYDSVLPRLFFVTLLAVIGMRFGQIITTLWSNYEGLESHWLSLRSPLFQIEILVGLILPTVLMANDRFRRVRVVQAVAGLLFMIGMFASRLELLINGQKVPLFKGYWAGYVEYWPSLTEWMLVPVGIGMFFALYGAGNWLLSLSDRQAPAH